ncbi:hypothetical protein ACFP63_06090 [Oerskovia jenensis]|uniref:Uncharacterized protein n=1 Tax=Oerskovia jenensis TaxID=162169 RepID=A0ABS2LGR6_9CELL|nr:hypothetical protein [Oerskovia jenensis]MBM7479616.1 hypothetical protein [Oerskovia jenensis]
MSAAGPQQVGSADEALPVVPVVPVLVRDYRRLVRLFPYSYRREHEAEMLGHLLDGALPGQSRPSGAERRDLVLAAVREWAVVPLGPTPGRRRSAATVLVLVLPLLLMVPAAKTLVSTAVAFEYQGPWLAVSSNPFAPGWVLWGTGLVLVLCGLVRAGRALVVAGAAVSTVALAVMIGQDVLLAAYVEAAWVLGLAAFALALVERTRTGERPYGWRWGIAPTGVALLLAALTWGEYAGAGPSWRYISPIWQLTTGTIVVPVVVGLVVLVVIPATRDAAPLLGGIFAAFMIGRVGIFGSRTYPFYGYERVDVVVLLLVSAATFLVLRWAVDRFGEPVEASGARSTGPTPA